MSALIIRPFNSVWWVVIAAIVGLSLLPGRLRRGKSAASNRRFLVWFDLFTLVFLFIYRCLLYITPNYDFIIWNELPFHACNMVSLLALPALEMADTGLGRAVKGFCFFGGLLFAPLAMMMPTEGFDAPPLFSVNAICFYAFHGLIMALAICFYTLGEYRPTYRDIPGVLAFFGALAALIHCLNLAMRATVYPDANYYYTFGIDGNPIMDLLKSFIPMNFFCVLPLLPAFGVAFLFVTFLVRLLDRQR